MRTIYECKELELMARGINAIGAAVDITKYKGRLRWVQLTLAESARDKSVIARVSPPVTASDLATVLR